MRLGRIIVSFVMVALSLLDATQARTIETQDEAVSALEQNGIKLGDTAWLKWRAGDVAGLTKIVVKDSTVMRRHEYGYRQLVVIGGVAGKDDVIIPLDIFNGLVDGPDATVGMFYTTDPSRRVAKWGKRVLDAIAKGSIFVGMTEEQARTSWGMPSRINTSGDSSGQREQWVYGVEDHSYIYFHNGKLSAWQN